MRIKTAVSLSLHDLVSTLHALRVSDNLPNNFTCAYTFVALYIQDVVN